MWESDDDGGENGPSADYRQGDHVVPAFVTSECHTRHNYPISVMFNICNRNSFSKLALYTRLGSKTSGIPVNTVAYGA